VGHLDCFHSLANVNSVAINKGVTIAKLWKQPRCSTTNEWIKKMWYLYTMEFYAAMKKNKMLSFAGKWMELENIILSEVSLAQKTKSYILLHMWTLDQGQTQQGDWTLST